MLFFIRQATVTIIVLGLLATAAWAQRNQNEAPRPADAKIKNPAGPVVDRLEGQNPAGSTPRATGERVTRITNKPVASNHSPEQVDQMVAGMLALCNEEEAAVGKFAAEHATHTDVKKFADMMAEEHGQMAKKLQKWAPAATLMNTDKHTEEKGQLATSTDKSRGEDENLPVTGTGQNFDPLHVHQQIGSRALASAKKTLGSKKGKDFDLAYLGSQCVLHQQMIDKASVFKEYVSPELKPTIVKGIESAQEHLDRAQELIGTLASSEQSRK